MHFHYNYELYGHAIAQKPLLGVHETYYFGRNFLGHHYYILSLSYLFLGVEKKILNEIMHFQFMNYMTTPQPRKPCPGGHEIYNFGRPFLGHHYDTLYDIQFV